ncbi:SDR family NAD(P)-dependent oxidoreductase [Actinocrinis puniceicyclus]|uniref:SDR family NAD(P)-dependent oxidoreductase n=1 Tax=Actinocrinis puniceicyclus TaxID=977794 RepID=A0A8J7WKF1_9ACTN|nr:oxidoreductase [Actinocrinis puniceicyclus]MBS2963926.1 SDR family NAD(P)-dependent oxidoreductase [Actinocrinis puniceicyclus]
MVLWKAWRAADAPDLSGRVALVTGATSGIGLETATQLARGGARTLLGCRDLGRGQRAKERIVERCGAASVELVRVDLADLESVRDAAREIADRAGHLDLLVNNAGVMAPPPQLTDQGFELQLGTNHLGHFALTGRLLPLLLAADGARVITVSSIAHHLAGGAGLSEPTDFKTLPHGSRWLGYARSKLANLLFALELDRQVRDCTDAATGLRSIAVHPGVTRSELVARASIGQRPLIGRIAQLSTQVISQSTASGALPTLYAATRADAAGGEFFGPRLGVRGAPVRVRPSHVARDAVLADRLWQASAAATGVGYEELCKPRRAGVDR